MSPLAPEIFPKTVIVVEDEMMVRELVVGELQEQGYSVVEFANADTALAYLNQNSDDALLVLTDVQMPGTLNGLELAEIVARTWPALPVLVTSGGALVDPKALPGKARFLPKPWHPSDMVDRVNGMVASCAS